MTPLATGLALLGALMVHAALGRLWPGGAPVLDPFLLVVVYAALTRGEVHGMLTGTAAGWLLDVQFGGPVAGFAALTKLVVGYGVGVAGARFLLVAPLPRLALVATASLFDALFFERAAAVLGAPVAEISLSGLALRASLNAVVALPLFHLLDRRLPRGEAA